MSYEVEVYTGSDAWKSMKGQTTLATLDRVRDYVHRALVALGKETKGQVRTVIIITPSNKKEY